MCGNFMKHVDYDWVSEKANGHGFAVLYNDPEGLLIVDWVGLWPWYKVFWLNIILFFRMLKRVISNTTEEKL